MEYQPSDKFDFLIYDFETNSLNKKLGQAYQFAGIKMTSNFELIEELEEKTHMLPYIIPGPMALQTTGLSPKDLISKDRNDEMVSAKKISNFFTGDKKISSGNDRKIDKVRIYTGYNTLSFDEELLRTILYRNLLEPYVTSGKTSRRLDLYPAFQYLNFIKPGIILPAVKMGGKESWRLSEVAEANGFQNANAHDALADTYMTAKLLERFATQSPDVFNEIVSLSNKERVAELIAGSDDYSIDGSPNFNDENYILQFTHFGEPNVVPLAPVAGIKKRAKTLFVDVSKDPDEWIHMSAEEIASQVFVGNSPFHVITPTKVPLIFNRKNSSLAKAIEEKDFKNHKELFEERSRMVHTPEIKDKMNKVMNILEEQTVAKFKNSYFSTEQRLYEGFFENSEKHKAKKFVQSNDWHKKSQIIPEMEDDRMREMANRLLGIFGPQELQTIESLESVKKQYEIRLLDLPVEESKETILTFKVARAELEEMSDLALKKTMSKFIDDLEIVFRKTVHELGDKIEQMKSINNEKNIEPIIDERKETEDQLGFLF